MERNIKNWTSIIQEAQYVDAEENYDGVYDAHLKAQAVIGADMVQFLSDELVAMRHKRRHITKGVSVNVSEGQEGGGSSGDTSGSDSSGDSAGSAPHPPLPI